MRIEYWFEIRLNGKPWDVLADGFDSEEEANKWFSEDSACNEEWAKGYSVHLMKTTRLMKPMREEIRQQA